tara:strand:+ start:2200 stop:2370 length:171 start_codon:yes stop_codon:yes gene_type:complete
MNNKDNKLPLIVTEPLQIKKEPLVITNKKDSLPQVNNIPKYTETTKTGSTGILPKK